MIPAPSHRALVLSLLAALFLVGTFSARAQEEPTDAPEEQPFFETVDVNVVNVDVFVTDKKGNPILDLEKDDFEILEDGRTVPITNFYAVRGERPEAPRPGARVPREAREKAEPAADERIDEAQRLYLIVFVDNFNIKPFNRNRVFRELRQFLRDTIERGDKVMLVTYDRTLETRVSFTGDPGVINRALLEIEEETGYNVHRDSERREVLRSIEESDRYLTPLQRVRTYAESYYSDVQFTLDAMRDLISSLGGLPGRKAMVHVSDGIPMIPGEDLFVAIQEKFQATSILSEIRQYDTSRRFEELARHANANRVTFYTIDAAGLRTQTNVSVEASTPGVGMMVHHTYVHNLQAPLLKLAEDTGGQAIINSNFVGDDLMEVAKDFDSYYSLGYQPAHAGDGRYHRIRVRVDREGAKVRHRTGYRDKSLSQRMSDTTMAALVFGEQSNPMGLDLRVGEAVPQTEGRHYTVPVTVEIPLDRLTMVPVRESHEARVQLFVAALDSEGGTSPVQNTRVPIRIPSEELERARTQSWAYEIPLLMRRGRQRLAVGLHDDLGGDTSFVTKSFVVGSS
ncbi:MAG: VWA domain-containing protein [Thermoanaerobaculia bacterium]|nr:VWA domain-containing protein [Thermoanaerobaculia bacterium]